MGSHNNIIWLSFLSIGSPKHKVLEAGHLKGLVQLKELSISPFGGARMKDQVYSSLQDLLMSQIYAKHVLRTW